MLVISSFAIHLKLFCHERPTSPENNCNEHLKGNGFGMSVYHINTMGGLLVGDYLSVFLVGYIIRELVLLSNERNQSHNEKFRTKHCVVLCPDKLTQERKWKY